MKKIMMFSMALFVTLASFADVAPSRLTVSSAGKNNIRVTVDEKKMNGQSGNSGSIFENLAPGYHTVRVYQFGKMVYSAAVPIKPMYEVSIVLDNRGNAIFNEQPIKNNNNCDIQYGGAISYEPAISYGEYTGIKAMMADARFDGQRLEIAKKAVDENTLAAIQIKEMAKLFKTESAQLEFAKYAYGRTADKNNYFLVCNTFPFGDDKADLTNYIRNYR